MKALPVMQKFLVLLAAAAILSGCSSTNPDPGNTVEQPSECEFANPIAWGQDPYVARRGDWYYLVESRDNAIYVYRSRDLTQLKQNGVKVWEPPEEGWNRSHLWAPELHFIDGRWYVYYAAGREGPPFIHQRSGVLQSAGADPQGAYTDRGMLDTGDAGGDDRIWAIDVTVAELDGQLFAVWSGWEENRSTDRTPQHLYIARMSDPWTISSERVKISSPTEPWEVGTELDLNEGAQFLRHGGDVFIIYSTRESWLPAYRLGQLRLASPGADPMDPDNWIKSGPVFTGTEDVHGVGHASFTMSPDSTEDWIVYHTKAHETPGWERVIHVQPFTWKADGAPEFGMPVPASEPIDVPSGRCE